MQRYSAAGWVSVTASTFQYGALWNPSSSKSLYLQEFWADHGGAATLARGRLVRMTATGTPGGTVTPDVDNDYDRAVAPPSGAVVYVPAWTVSGTNDASILSTFTVQSAGGEISLRFGDRRGKTRGHRGHGGGIRIPAGSGVSVDIVAGLADIRCVWVWEE